MPSTKYCFATDHPQGIEHTCGEPLNHTDDHICNRGCDYTWPNNNPLARYKAAQTAREQANNAANVLMQLHGPVSGNGLTLCVTCAKQWPCQTFEILEHHYVNP